MPKAIPILTAALLLFVATPMATAADSYGDGDCEPPNYGALIYNNTTATPAVTVWTYTYCYYDEDAPFGGNGGEGVAGSVTRTGTNQGVYYGVWHVDNNGPAGASACGAWIGYWNGSNWVVLRSLPCANLDLPYEDVVAALP